MQLIGEGAEAKMFKTRIMTTYVAVKYRGSKKYRIPELDTELREGRTRKEAKVMEKAKEAGVAVPRILAISRFSIYMEHLHGALLKDIAPKTKRYTEAGELLAKLHKANIVHGDYTPANLLVSSGATYVIDFGLSDLNGSLEEKAIDLLLMKHSTSRSNYAALLSSYEEHYGDAKLILKRLSEIEKRGRYQTRTLE